MPGGEVLTLLDAFNKAGIEFYLSKHENAGGFMAEGVWHRTGAPAVLLATLGPGVTNAVNVAVNSDQDRVPLIVISGCIDQADQATYNHQVVDHQQLLRPVCKASFMLNEAGASALCDKAVNIALQGRPGPVHIDVPISVAAAPAKSGTAPRRASLEVMRPAAGPGLDKARAWLRQAERPLMIVGYDAVLDGSAAAVGDFSRELGIPVLTTYKAKGVIPEDDDRVVASIALSPRADDLVKPLVEQADLLVLAGYDPIEMRTGWRDAWNLETQHVVELSTEPNEHYFYQSSLSFIGNIGEGLKALAEGGAGNGTWSNGAPASVRDALAGAFGERDDWGPAAIADEVRKNTPRDTIATMDTGAHRIVASQVWRCFEPDSLLQSVGLGSMGCGLPLAIGAKLASPERPVVAMTGDAGLMMALGELSTLSDFELPIVLVVFVDRSLALIEIKQRQRELVNVGVDFLGDYDYLSLARAFGGKGYRINDRRGLKHALEEALSSDRFSLLACEFDRKAYDGRM